MKSIKLSVIIVNYNVSHFLNQCLFSVNNALQNIQGEIFVIDNNSVDDSVKMVRENFPDINLIVNKENVGFAKANNQAIRKAKGEYILLLNPDTVVEDNTFEKVIHFMDSHPEAGGLGVKMVDGSGKFLPESKRGLPTPSAAFFKIFGFSKLFPRSKKFSRYHLGFLDEDKIHEVDVLAGAFMLLRKSVIDKIGALDEDFFMYGEDIDLSYRITQAGYKNYYFPETQIIHYKGESTKKGSINYVLVFYKAMIIFSRKHFTAKKTRSLTLLINLAVYFRALLALFSRISEKVFLPFSDAIILITGLWIIKNYWASHYIYINGGDYPATFVYLILPVYFVIWMATLFFSGAYDKPYKISKSIQGILLGSIIILILYALLPESLRFSRAQILLDSLWGLVLLPAVRYFFIFLKVPGFFLTEKKNKRFLIIGDEKETERVAGLLKNVLIDIDYIGLINPITKNNNSAKFIGDIDQVKDILTIFNINEVVFCSKNLSYQLIINKMMEWKDKEIKYKIAPAEGFSIIGSDSIHSQGELYTFELNPVHKKSNRRNKRLLDVMISVFFIIILPFMIFVVRNPRYFIRNIIRVLSGKYSWVGYMPQKDGENYEILLKPGILNPMDAISGDVKDTDTINKINYLYIRDYSLLKDINIILFSHSRLGRNPGKF